MLFFFGCYSWNCFRSPAEALRAWFNPAENNKDVRPVDSVSWLGWQSSLDALKELVEKNEFDGILGFSQGAAVAGLLLTLYPSKFRYAILISGFTPMDPAVSALYPAAPIGVPSLHIMGTSDPFVSITRAESLSGKFSNPTILVHQEGHVMPPKELFNLIKEWVSPFQ
jgi:predicted esterase